MTLSTSTTAVLTAAIAAAAAITKKFLPPKKPKPEYISRAEFHDGLDKVRDRIGASYLALADKIDLRHRETASALDRVATTFERRIDNLESNLARLDERRSVSAHQSINPIIH